MSVVLVLAVLGAVFVFVFRQLLWAHRARLPGRDWSVCALCGGEGTLACNGQPCALCSGELSEEF